MYFIKVPQMGSLQTCMQHPMKSPRRWKEWGTCHLVHAWPGGGRRKKGWREVWRWLKAGRVSYADRHLRASHPQQSVAANRQLIPSTSLEAADAWHHGSTVPWKDLWNFAFYYLYLYVFWGVLGSRAPRMGCSSRIQLCPNLFPQKAILSERCCRLV